MTTDVRERLTRSAQTMATMGANPRAPDAYQSYLELIAPSEAREAQLEMGALNSSGLVAAALLRAVGVVSERLDPPYVMGTSVSRLVNLAGDAGAWVPFADGQIPGPGDVVILRKDPHHTAEAYLVTAIRGDGDEVQIDSVEAAAPGDGTDAVVTRQHRWKGPLDLAPGSPQGARAGRVVDGWIDVSLLELTEGDLSLEGQGAQSFAEGEPERLAPDITKVSAEEMIEALAQAWEALFGSAPARASVLVLAAQWAIETGWGKGMHAYNIGNIKSAPTDGEDYTYFACDEYLGGRHVWFYPDSASCRFRAYKTLELGAVDYLKTVSQRYAASWTAVVAGDPAQYAHLLKLQKYYTGSEQEYTSGLVSIVHQIERMTKADAPAPAPTDGKGPALQTTLGVQQALQQLGYDVGTPDGKDGPHTRLAVQAFQRSAGLTADGLVGPATRAALAAALAKLAEAPPAQA